ncbi:hypothetical protein BRC86_14080, partial [Halobacteriales archaeon QS_3_64_16]
MKLTGLPALGGLTGVASGGGTESSGSDDDGDTDENGSGMDGTDELPKPVRADEPSESVQALLDELA